MNNFIEIPESALRLPDRLLAVYTYMASRCLFYADETPIGNRGHNYFAEISPLNVSHALRITLAESKKAISDLLDMGAITDMKENRYDYVIYELTESARESIKNGG